MPPRHHVLAEHRPGAGAGEHEAATADLSPRLAENVERLHRKRHAVPLAVLIDSAGLATPQAHQKPHSSLTPVSVRGYVPTTSSKDPDPRFRDSSVTLVEAHCRIGIDCPCIVYLSASLPEQVTPLDIHQFWGKAQPHQGSGPQWHPLTHHSLDVAAVGEALLARPRSPARNLVRLLGWSHETTVRIGCFLLTIHDVGKFARKFQAKVPERFPDCFNEDARKLPTRYDHGAGGLRLFDADPSILFGHLLPDNHAWRPLVCAVVGHHGEPPNPTFDTLVGLRPDFGKAGIDAARSLIAQARRLFNVTPGFAPLSEERASRASFTLAGLAVLADWIGSNQDWFPYQEPVEDLRAYWEDARKRASAAVEQAGILPAGIGRRLSYGDLIGTKATASPMQEWASKTDLPSGPALFLIEDETGSGKTEAATMLAHRLMLSGQVAGLYVALPTMATANAMFDRLARVYRLLFAHDAEPSVALVHGAREMHETFRNARLAGARREQPYSQSGDAGAVEITASAACADWIADDRRRAFLADLGAGTVDQALLSVLPSRHQSLRLLGLTQRVLVLDEVHAYDAYMQREIERLLEFQAALGGSAILLSATLPLTMRNRLTDAFAKGLGDQSEGENTMAYPLATVRAHGVHRTEAIRGQPGRGRRLPVRFLRSSDAAVDEVEMAAKAGKAVLYIRNTVDDVLDAYTALIARNLTPDIFHARFALADRLQIERRVVAMFGKDSTPKCRAGRVLLATQVVEQSLDLDFDVLITDLAPIDLLIQRAGRLWRHRRNRKGCPELVVVGPEPSDDADENWFSRAFPRAAYVYRNHAHLWLTARRLQDAGAVDSPMGLRTLIESVYGDDVDTQLPDALRRFYWEAQGKAGAERGVANTNVLDFATGYLRDGGAWDTDIRTPTRLNDDPQQTLRLGRVRRDKIVPYALDAAPGELWRAWRLSEVSVPARRVSGESLNLEHRSAAELAKAGWSRFDAETILVVLQASESSSSFVCTALSAGDQPREVSLSYDAKVGLKWL